MCHEQTISSLNLLSSRLHFTFGFDGGKDDDENDDGKESGDTCDDETLFLLCPALPEVTSTFATSSCEEIVVARSRDC